MTEFVIYSMMVNGRESGYRRKFLKDTLTFDLKNFYGHSITVIYPVDPYFGWYKVNGRYITLMINSL